MHLPVKGIHGSVSLCQTRATFYNQWMAYIRCIRTEQDWIMMNHATSLILICTLLWQTRTDYVPWLLMAHCEYHMLPSSECYRQLWYDDDKSHHSAAEHRASTRILHLALFLASVLISTQVFLTPSASLSTVLRHVFLGLPLPHMPWGFHSRTCLAMSSDGFRNVWPSHPHLRFLICKSILGCFVRYHSSLFLIWSGQKFSVFSLGIY